MKPNKININNLFYIFITSHLIIWTLVPTLTNHNLPLDTIEALAWGSNLDWGYNKHPPASAFFIAQKVRSNVRELEGALKRVIASSNFTGSKIDIGLIKDSLKDLLAIQARQVSVDNIQKTVAEYYNVKLSDLLSKRRSRSVARPRQMSMFLAKELTNHSLPEIGESFGGRDHTTVLHACKKIKELRDFNNEIEQDYRNLVRALTI